MTRVTAASRTDADFNAFDFARQTGTDQLRTSTAELRFDSSWSTTISTLFGLFYSHETLSGVTDQVFPLCGASGSARPGPSRRSAARSTSAPAILTRLSERSSGSRRPAWEVALGLRLDHEKRSAAGSLGSTACSTPPATSRWRIAPDATVAPIDTVHSSRRTAAEVHAHQALESPDFMTYALGFAKGFRGGGFNGPTAPFRTYKGDFVWTYELGSKYSWAAAPRLPAPSSTTTTRTISASTSSSSGSTGSPVTVDLNTGDVRSYGAELEFCLLTVPQWTITGGGS